MGKQAEGNDQLQKKETTQLKKKIVKKLPVKMKIKDDDDDLKDWKPVKIQRKTQKTQSTNKNQQNIATSFLSSLTRPVNFSQKNSKFSYDDDEQPLTKISKPSINTTKLTPQQIKWDIEDQTFIRKQFLPKTKIEHHLEQNAQQEEPQEIIVIKNSKNKKEQQIKTRHIDFTKVIDESWKQAAQRKQMKKQLWQSSNQMLEGRGDLARMAKQAQQKTDEIDFQMSRRAQQRKQMKGRYGW